MRERDGGRYNIPWWVDMCNSFDHEYRSLGVLL